MSRGPFDRVAVADMDERYAKRLRKLQLVVLAVCTLIFVGIVVIELLSQFHASFIYLFAIALTVLVFLFASDAISSRLDAYEAEKVWRATVEESEA